MHTVSTNFRETFTMAEPIPNIDDLEDGEIESDGEAAADVQHDSKIEERLEGDAHGTEENQLQDNMEQQEFFFNKSGKKKKSKSKGDKFKDKNKKKGRHNVTTEDDFAGSIEKAIRKALNKNDGGEDELRFDNEPQEERRKHKKRKKHDGRDGLSKKRKKQETPDDMDESEMMCVRGASPVHRNSPSDMYPDDDQDSYVSESSNDSRGLQQQRPQRHRMQRERNKNNKNDRRRGGGAHPMQDPEGVCLYYMQGKCHKGDDCAYSHDAQPPRKMELCKFYLMECCAKREKCLYMHADFPCKYYHTGLPCIYKEECKFAHGKPLTDSLKNILLKHIESAPKEILGDFPRLNKEGAMKMIQSTQNKLLQIYPNPEIPSLFELNIPTPQNGPDNTQGNSFDRQNRISPKIRPSRWQNDMPHQSFNVNVSPVNNVNTQNILSLKNLTGVLTPRQISNLTKMGIENLDQLGQLTVLQLNSIGISVKQITDIQLNTMSIQNLGYINSNPEQSSQPFNISSASNKDLDLRVPPSAPVSSNIAITSELPGQDVDMRFQSSASVSMNEDVKPNKDMIDIDQYTKDALKFASKDKENIDISNETFESEKPMILNEIKDVDHRVLPFSDEGVNTSSSTAVDNTVKSSDTDIRFLRPEPIFKSPEKRNRRSTTDDEDNNLLIDEKWYSSDEEKGAKRKSPLSSPQSLLSPQPTPTPHVIEPSNVLSKLGDLSKIDISEEVTKLLNTMKNNLQEIKSEPPSDVTQSPKSRDPRSKRSPDKNSDSNNKVHNRRPRVSIYECVDGEPTDGRRRSDVDLRKSDFPFGDTDLRQGGSVDIDFRLGLPFKAIPNYTPASEINGSINSHPPIPYKLVQIVIPRPDYTDIRNSTAKSQALQDPRLRKVFRLSIDESNSDSEKPKPAAPAAPAAPRVDPRRKQKESTEASPELKTNSLDIQTVLQNSNWFKDLSSTQKIFVNQNLTPVTQMIKQFNQDKTPGKKLDLTPIQSNTILCSILANLGVTLGENGEYSYLPKPKGALLQTPVNINPSQMQFSNSMTSSSVLDSGNVNMMNMSQMGMTNMSNMNVGPPMHGFTQPMADPRAVPTPGLLGIAPNMPHNFNASFGGPNNFGFNGPNPGNDFNFMDGDQNYQRFPHRGGHRGRGNDRWNRGGSGRGHRDRKNFMERGNWKIDRH